MSGFEELFLGMRRLPNASSLDKIKIGFPKKNGRQFMLMYLGSKIAMMLGIKDKDRLSIAVHKESDKVWFIKKSDMGRAVTNINKARKKNIDPLYKFQMIWNRPIPEGMGNTNDHANYKFVSYEVFNGGMKLYLPGTTDEERELT